MKIIDLSHPLSTNMPVYPGTMPAELTNNSVFSEDGHREKKILINSHTGTHIDAPAHMMARGKYLDELPINTYFGKAIVVDVSVEPNRAIPLKWIEHIRNDSGLEYIVFRTGGSQYWDTEKYFTDFKYPSLELSERLVALKLKGIGIDVSSVDPVGADSYDIHYTLLGAGLVLVENLTNLEQLPENQVFDFACFPLHIRQADGSPVRAVAMLDGES